MQPRLADPRPRDANQSVASTSLGQTLAGARAWARPATTGARLAAFAIDLVAVLVVALIVWFGFSSPWLTVIAAVEAAVLFAFVEARTGATLGNLALRIRTVRDDSPYTPGVRRGTVRSLVLGAATLVAVVGGFAVVTTSAFDPMRMGRSWADRAGRTLVVRVSTRADRESWAQGVEVWAANALVAPASVNEPFALPAEREAPAVALQRLPPPPPEVPTFPADMGSVDAPISAPTPVRHVAVGEQLLLTLDTGQRLQLPIPLVLNLGRKPDPSDSTDQLWAVEDPDRSVSKTHLRLECRGESVWLTDLGSTNGTAVLDETGVASPLTPGSRIRLEEGSRVQIGDRTFTVATVVG